jgi:acyl-coenzyme A thioesterase PaaI-like protein
MSDDAEPPHQLDVPAGYDAFRFRRGFASHIGPLYRRHSDSAMGFRVEAHHTNGMSNAHGGMLMSFADMAWGHMVSVETSSYWVTVRLSCDFLSGAKLGDWVEGNAELLSRDGDLFVTRGRIWVGDKTLMTGQGIFKALDKRAPMPGEKAYRAVGRD